MAWPKPRPDERETFCLHAARLYAALVALNNVLKPKNDGFK
jgi:hypothetical protein